MAYIRSGFNYVVGFGEAGMARLEEARQARLFINLADFCRRTQLPRRIVEKLSLVVAMDRWGLPRRKLLWKLGQLRYQEQELEVIFPQKNVHLSSLSREEEFLAVVKTLGLSIGEHGMTYYRDWLSQQGVLTIQELATCPVGKRVRVAGLLVVHQSPPTAKGFHCSARDGASHIQLLEQMIPHFPAELWLVIEDNLTIHKSRDVQTTLLA